MLTLLLAAALAQTTTLTVRYEPVVQIAKEICPAAADVDGNAGEFIRARARASGLTIDEQLMLLDLCSMYLRGQDESR